MYGLQKMCEIKKNQLLAYASSKTRWNILVFAKRGEDHMLHSPIVLKFFMSIVPPEGMKRVKYLDSMGAFARPILAQSFEKTMF
jgi:hypothetical protein